VYGVRKKGSRHALNFHKQVLCCAIGRCLNSFRTNLRKICNTTARRHENHSRRIIPSFDLPYFTFQKPSDPENARVLNAERSPTKPVPKYPALTTRRHVRRCHCTRSHLVTVENRWNQNAALSRASNYFWNHSKPLVSSKHHPLATHSRSNRSGFSIKALLLSVRQRWIIPLAKSVSYSIL
jgi:hypothetical protein